MTAQHTKVGIDIGTQAIKIVCTESIPGQLKPRIVHTSRTPSAGFRHGYITDLEAASTALKQALAKYEKETKTSIQQARFAIGGIGLASQYVRTSIDVMHKHSEISEKHVDEVIHKAEDLFINKYPNKKILHIIPVKYSVDHRDVLGTPIGMYGQHLEIKIVFITILEHHYDSFIQLIEKNNIHPLEVIAAPVADAAASLSIKQKTHGCLMSNIGADTTSSASFENGILSALEVIPLGSNDITNDIALGLQIPIEEAEDVKLLKNTDYPKRKIEEIIHARASDILELLEKFLVKIKKNRLLPAGVIFTGGGAATQDLASYAKHFLRIPAHIHQQKMYSPKHKKEIVIDPAFSVAYGLCCGETGHQSFGKEFFSFKNMKKHIRYWLHQIMP